MGLDRKLQLDLLTKIAECYPFEWDDYERNVDSEEYLKAAINLHYLMRHGLLAENSTVAKPNMTGDGGGHVLMAMRNKWWKGS